jgi:tetratricopeptide (TPR) repeat protein
MTRLLKRVATTITIILCVSAMNVAAQSAEEVYELYQKGMKAIEAKDYETAINDLTASLTMYGKITDFEGIEGIDVIKEGAEQALSQTYYTYAMDLYQEKNFDKALEHFKNTENIAKNSNNNDLAARASSYIVRVYVSKASAAFVEKQYDETITAADEALKIDNENDMAYLWRGRAYKEKNDLGKMKADLDKCMELTKDNEQKVTTYSNAAKIAGAAYMSAGTTAITNKKYTEAISNLETAVSYPEINANAYYYLALAYNALSKWNDAVTASNKALAMDLKDPSATYLELGKAYEGLGKKTEACNAYKKVTTEQFKKVADYQIQQVLKCN